MKYSIKKHSFFSYLTQYHERNQFFIATPHSDLGQRSIKRQEARSKKQENSFSPDNPCAWATGHSECIKKALLLINERQRPKAYV